MQRAQNRVSARVCTGRELGVGPARSYRFIRASQLSGLRCSEGRSWG